MALISQPGSDYQLATVTLDEPSVVSQARGALMMPSSYWLP